MVRLGERVLRLAPRCWKPVLVSGVATRSPPWTPRTSRPWVNPRDPNDLSNPDLDKRCDIPTFGRPGTRQVKWGSKRGNVCISDNRWTFGDGFQTLSNAGSSKLTSTTSSGLMAKACRSTRWLIDSASTAPRSSTTSTAEAHAARRPPDTRKMTDREVQQAATRYGKGESLKVVASRFGVDQRTLARELKKAGIPTRPRWGWPLAP
jgi:hypothetical protein